MNEYELYQALGIDSDIGLLEHFPRRYQSLIPTADTKNLQDEQEVIIFGEIKSLSCIQKPLSIIRFYLENENGNFNLAIYGQKFYQGILHKGKRILAITKYKAKTKSFVVKSILNEDSPYLKSGIKPIYSLPKNVQLSYFTFTVNRILTTRSQYIFNIVPPTFIEKYKLEDRVNALKYIHQPQSKEELERGLRTLKYEEALRYCTETLILKKRRSSIKKLTTSKIPKEKVGEFISTLPYQLTDDQLKSIEEIVTDLNSDTVMYRLLQGDVGTGKTLVALLSLYANYLRGDQGALLAPTQILASQHYKSALKLFKDLNIKIAFLTTKSKTREKREILAGLADGSIDIIVGTHSILGEKLVYKSLALAIIDEQQNFGVKQRNDLINKGLNTDLLMMTATPIPRTLTKVMNSDMDVSTLHTFPTSKRNVKTVVLQSNDTYIDRAIKRALEIKRQVFVVAPKIIDTESGQKEAVQTIYSKMVRDYGDRNVALLHGRMKEEVKNEVYQRFLNGECLILVATSIIEVGLDVQRACLMIIYSANTFGLSSLHQLRGRIGRSGDNALAILVYDGDDEEAESALRYLASNDDGFSISSYDLQHRGSGSLTGNNQSGDSELKVANFVKDERIFKTALSDASYILENLGESTFNLYYLDILKRLDTYKID